MTTKRNARSAKFRRLLHSMLPLTLLLSASCTTVGKETADSIAAREPILMQTSSAIGVIYDSKDGAVTWSGGGTLILTPTTLYHLSGTTRSLSYAMVESVSIEKLPDSLGFVRGKSRDNLLRVNVSRPVCGEGCVFNLVDNPELVPEALALIENGRKSVDPFGGAHAPRPVWLAAGIRNSRFWWSIAPAYLEKNEKELKRSIDETFCTLLDCRGSGSSASIYGTAMRRAFETSDIGAYEFRELPGVALNHRAELSTGTLARLLSAEDQSVDALLVSDLTAVTLRERISPDYTVSIEVTVKSFVDYFSLQPLRDGRYFWNFHTVTRTAAEWLAMDAAGFAETLRQAAEQNARQVLTELEQS